MKILVVEDEAVTGFDLVAMLDDWGYSSSGPLSSNEEALAAIAATNPDAVLLDIKLRGGAWSEPVADDLRKRGIPFLCLTGFDSHHSQKLSAFEGVPHLEKPMDSDALREAIESLLATKGRG